MNQKKLETSLLTIKKEISEYLIPNDPETFQKTITALVAPFKKSSITKVAAIDMKGLMYGPVIAHILKVPFVPILKGGKIQNREKVIVKSYVDYSGKEKSLEIFLSSISQRDKVLLVDDWFDSGNTGRAALELIERLGGKVKGISVIFNQLQKEDELFFKKYKYHFLVRLPPKERTTKL